MTEIREVSDPVEKSNICNDVLRSLPDWFGIESSIVNYVKHVRSMPFYAAFNDDKTIGFVALKIHGHFTSEVYVMAVLKEYHRQGIGRMLIEHCEMLCRKFETEFLTVKTLDGSIEDQYYEKTRLFYLSVGFRPLEVFPLLWNNDNPCLFMAKVVSRFE